MSTNAKFQIGQKVFNPEGDECIVLDIYISKATGEACYYEIRSCEDTCGSWIETSEDLTSVEEQKELDAEVYKTIREMQELARYRGELVFEEIDREAGKITLTTSPKYKVGDVITASLQANSELSCTWTITDVCPDTIMYRMRCNQNNLYYNSNWDWIDTENFCKIASAVPSDLEPTSAQSEYNRLVSLVNTNLSEMSKQFERDLSEYTNNEFIILPQQRPPQGCNHQWVDTGTRLSFCKHCNADRPDND